MAADDLTLAMRLYADARKWVSGLNDASSGTRKFVSSAKREFAELTKPLRGIQGALAGIGVTFVATQQVIQSARLDKSLSQIGLTAGVGQKKVALLREEIFNLAQETGRPVQQLLQGFNNLIQSGLAWDEALRVITATNKALAVTDANANALTGGLTVAAEAFNFDLSQPNKALKLLDKMTVAGRLGNAELENLSSIFARVGVNARSANLGFGQTLAFIEGLSLIERNPERLATLADSTLRLFTNLRYLRSAQQATGVDFFNRETGERRNPLDVLRDLRKEFQKLQTDAQRASFIQSAFGSADLDTQRGLRSLLSGDTLTKIGTFNTQIANAGGTLNKDLERALDNAVDQVGRLKSTLTEAVEEGFAKPLNKSVSEAIKFGLDKKGLDLSGEEILLGGAGLAAVTALTARYGGKGFKKLLGGTAGGLAKGKILEEVAGVTDVYVVNMPDGNGGLFPGGKKSPKGLTKTARGIPKGVAGAGAGLAALGTSAAWLAAAGAAGYGAGTLIYQLGLKGTKFAHTAGRGESVLLAALGNDTAQATLEGERKHMLMMRTRRQAFMADAFPANRGVLQASLQDTIANGVITQRGIDTLSNSGELKISVSDERVRVTKARALPGLDFDIRNGPAMVSY